MVGSRSRKIVSDSSAKLTLHATFEATTSAVFICWIGIDHNYHIAVTNDHRPVCTRSDDAIVSPAFRSIRTYIKVMSFCELLHLPVSNAK